MLNAHVVSDFYELCTELSSIEIKLGNEMNTFYYVHFIIFFFHSVMFKVNVLGVSWLFFSMSYLTSILCFHVKMS